MYSKLDVFACFIMAAIVPASFAVNATAAPSRSTTTVTRRTTIHSTVVKGLITITGDANSTSEFPDNNATLSPHTTSSKTPKSTTVSSTKTRVSTKSASTYATRYQGDGTSDSTPFASVSMTSLPDSAHSGENSDTDTHFITLLTFVASDTVLLVVIIIVVVIAGICIYGRLRIRELRTDLESRQPSRGQCRMSGSLEASDRYVNARKNVTSESCEAGNTETIDTSGSYDVVTEFAPLDRYTSLQTVHPGIDRSMSVDGKEEAVEKHKKKNRKKEKKEKRASDQVEMNVSSATTSDFVEDDPSELYENWSGP